MKRLAMWLWAPLLLGAGSGDVGILVVDGVHSVADLEPVSDGLEVGAASVRTYRRFLEGAGWGHTLEVAGFSSASELHDVRSQLEARGLTATRIGGADTSEPAARPVAPTPVGEEPERPRIEPTISVSADRKAEAWLKGAAKAHGGSLGPELLAGAVAVSFRFEREVDLGGETLVARHDYRRQGVARRLQVDVVSGPGAASTTVISPARRATVYASGETREARPDRTEGVVDRFGPEAILGLPLGLGWALEEGVDWRGLQISSKEGTQVLLEPQLSREAGVLFARFDATTDRLMEVHLLRNGITRRWMMADYLEYEDGLVFPTSVEVWEGETRLEALRVEALQILPELPNETFDHPGSVEQ